MKLMLWLFCGALSLHGFQAPSAGKPTDEKCSIEGRVVNAVTGGAVREAALVLRGQSVGMTPRTTESDETGHFAFRELRSGKYVLLVERPGFVRQLYGARSNPYYGTTLRLSPGQQLKDLTFRLAPGAVISGKVRDEEGEPVQNAAVMALRTEYQHGERRFVPLGVVLSNDAGEFRIAGLAAGRYLVSATPRSMGMSLSGVGNKTPADKPEPAYIRSYYPNSADPSTASQVQVGLAAEAAGTEIRLVKVNTVRIKGRLVGTPAGKTALVWLTPKGAGTMGMMARSFAVAQTAGAFEIRGVAPGSYTLSASISDSMGSEGASLPVQVGDQHIEGIVLSMEGGGELAGTLTVEGKEPVKPGSIHVVLSSLDFESLSPPRTTVGDDGKFTLKGISPDRYYVNVYNEPENSYVKSVHYGDQEIAEREIDLSSGVHGALQITISLAGARVDGTIHDENGKPVSGAVVVLVPGSRRYSLYGETYADQNGGFNFRGVTPGEYKILAWADIETGAYQDPEFLKRFESLAQALTLTEDDHQSVTLKVIR